MALVVRNPTANRGWIQAMIFVQAVDWLVVVISLLRGVVTLAQVATAPYLPIVFIVCLLIAYPRKYPPDITTPQRVIPRTSALLLPLAPCRAQLAASQDQGGRDRQ